MDRYETVELDVCQDCLIFLANGDDTDGVADRMASVWGEVAVHLTVGGGHGRGTDGSNPGHRTRDDFLQPRMRQVMSKQVKRALIGAAVVAWLGVSGLCLSLMSDESTVDAPAVVVGCPTEDSCDIDYRDGVWHIVPERDDARPSDSSAADVQIRRVTP